MQEVLSEYFSDDKRKKAVVQMITTSFNKSTLLR